MKKNTGNFASFVRSALVILVSVFAIYGFVLAGSLSPSASPVATGYTLNDIYNRLITNATATSGDHIFSPGASPIATLHTLTEIYGAIPTIDASKVKLGTPYLGVDGTLVPDGTATVGDCLATKTFYSGDSWTQKTGSIATQTLSADSDTVSAGYYAATTLSGVDADLAEGNIKKNTAIFGITGTLYGDTDATKVCSNASAAGTLTIDASKMLSSATYCGTGGSIVNCSSEGGNTCYAASGYWASSVSSNVSGADGSISFNIPDGYYSGKTATAVDGDLVETNIKSGANIFGVTGNSNVVNTASGDATIGDILSGKKAYVGGAMVTGNIANCGSEGSQTCYVTGLYYAGTSKTASNSTVSQSAGYYPAFNLSTIDTDLIASNISANVSIFGLAGTLLKNQYNGSAKVGATDYTFWTQAKGGVDDYDDNQGAPTDSYAGQWLTCNVNAYDAVTNPGGNWCNTGDSNANKKDLSTGLVWSTNLNLSTWFVANSCYPPETPTYNPGVCAAHGDDGCQCVKLPAGSKTGCEVLGDGGWRLPYQKELMQVYINGSWANLTSAGYYYWSSTTRSTITHYAWVVRLDFGSTSGDLKTITASYRARCVR